MGWTVPQGDKSNTFLDVDAFRLVVTKLEKRANACCVELPDDLYSIADGMPVRDGILSTLQDSVFDVAKHYVDKSVDYAKSNWTNFPEHLVPSRLQARVLELGVEGLGQVPETSGVFNRDTQEAVAAFLNACSVALDLCTDVVGCLCSLSASINGDAGEGTSIKRAYVTPDDSSATTPTVETDADDGEPVVRSSVVPFDSTPADNNKIFTVFDPVYSQSEVFVSNDSVILPNKSRHGCSVVMHIVATSPEVSSVLKSTPVSTATMSNPFTPGKYQSDTPSDASTARNAFSNLTRMSSLPLYMKYKAIEGTYTAAHYCSYYDSGSSQLLVDPTTLETVSVPYVYATTEASSVTAYLPYSHAVDTGPGATVKKVPANGVNLFGSDIVDSQGNMAYYEAQPDVINRIDWDYMKWYNNNELGDVLDAKSRETKTVEEVGYISGWASTRPSGYDADAVASHWNAHIEYEEALLNGEHPPDPGQPSPKYIDFSSEISRTSDNYGLRAYQTRRKYRIPYSAATVSHDIDGTCTSTIGPAPWTSPDGEWTISGSRLSNALNVNNDYYVPLGMPTVVRDKIVDSMYVYDSAEVEYTFKRFCTYSLLPRSSGYGIGGIGHYEFRRPTYSNDEQRVFSQDDEYSGHGNAVDRDWDEDEDEETTTEYEPPTPQLPGYIDQFTYYEKHSVATAEVIGEGFSSSAGSISPRSTVRYNVCELVEGMMQSAYNSEKSKFSPPSKFGTTMATTSDGSTGPTSCILECSVDCGGLCVFVYSYSFQD